MRQEATRLSASPPGERPHRSIRRDGSPARVATAALAAILAALILAACGGDASPDADSKVEPPTASPAIPAATEGTPTPRPTRASADPVPLSTAQVLLGRATQLEHDGFWEDAADARRLALSDDSAAGLPSEALNAAYLAQVRLLLDLGEPTNAALTLAQLDQAAVQPSLPHAGPLALARGRVLTANGDAQAALSAYDAYLSMEGPAEHIALLERARLSTATGDSESALRDYVRIREDPATPPLDLESALLEGGLLLENNERYAEADEWYQRLYTVSPWLSDDTFALHRSGDVRFAQGDTSGALAAWTELLIEYPGHWRAVEAYDGLLSAGLAPDPLVEGLFFYRQSRIDDAIAVYSAVLAGVPTAAEAGIATYYLAAIDEDLGNTATAVDGYLEAVDIDPAGPQADDALWWAARLLDQDGANALAQISYERLADDYPDRAFGAEAAFRAPLSAYRAGNLIGAADSFRVLTTAENDDDAQRAWLWLGKSLDAAGDLAGAEEAFQAAAAPDPNDYHGLRARAHLDAAPLAPRPIRDSIVGDPLANAPATTDWLEVIAPGEGESANRELDDSADWQAGLDLWEAGHTTSANARFQIALARTDNPWALFEAGQVLGALDAVHLRLDAGLALLARVPAAERATAPAEILRWAYPRGWPALAASAARNSRLDELLLYAVIRQESRFNPGAGSVAGALGLTQVIPTTGADIARTLGDPAFETALLFRPERSIRYGAAYLGAQLTNFDQTAGIALAAYNGGPGNAAAWSAGAAAFDPDLFYEQITFEETRSYVRLVLENYAWYQYIYRGGDAPSIVFDGP